MKINPKFISLAAAAVLSLSAVSASAAALPVPADNNEAFAMAESFYYDGLYYEALGELNMVDPSKPYYDANKVAAWSAKINYEITRMEIAEHLDAAKWYYEAGNYTAAYNEVLAAQSLNFNQSEYYSIRYWEETIINKVAELAYDALIDTECEAVIAVSAQFPLMSEYEWYVPVKVDNGYDVYIQTQLPGGGKADVACINVTTDGVLTRDL